MKYDASKLLHNLSEEGMINKKMKTSVGVYCDSVGKKMEGYAKKNAPWHNRTGNARRTIKGGSAWQDEHICDAYVGGNMDYSPFLELAKAKGMSTDNEVNMEVDADHTSLNLNAEGKYSIFRQTVRKFIPEVVTGMVNLLDKRYSSNTDRRFFRRRYHKC
ncbi:hypothetical protein J2Z42_001247 [Clostridium algifaecis]|uniref:Uncharacterized protein n=1 Tax=Clostridium algifaecis TaxID=1472040 RepID=A0ABS4KRB7_9CLOT|nr:hypothetical protein [Clostridium algifaecis]MBP2032575.1 hypothetical protein [Clostridium algifaecis]